MRALVGFDGSEGAHDAVELARWLLAGEEAGEALLVNVLPHPGALPVAYYLLGYEESPWASGFFGPSAEELAPNSVSWSSYVGGSPAHILTGIAEDRDFDLIVVGSPHRGAVGRALLGSVAQGVLHGSPLPVVVAPRAYAHERHDPPRRIAVAYDGSAEAGVALATAAGLARGHAAALELLAVATVSPEAAIFLGPEERRPPTAAEILEQGLDHVEEDVEARTRQLHGATVAAALADGCGDVDLLVAGSRGYGFLGRVLIGSVSSELIRTAPCPVMVVPRPGDGHRR